MADEFKAKGNAAFSSGNYTEAVKHFSDAIEADGSNHVLYSNRSGAYAAMGDYAKAKADAEACIAKKADWFKGYSRLGAALHGMKQFDESIAQYEKALTMAEGNNAATVQSSIEEVKKDREAQKAQANNPFAKIFGPDTLQKIAANPKLAPLLVKPGFEQKIRMIMQNPGMIQSMMQDQDIMTVFIELMGLQGQFAKGGDDDDASPAARRERAPEQQPAKKAEPAAKPAAKPAAEKTPAMLCKEEGNKFYLEKKFDEALAKYDEAIKLEPSNTTFLLNRTAVLLEQGKFDQVIEESDKALEHAREHKADFAVVAKLMSRKATALWRQDKHDEAIPLFKHSLVEHRTAETLTKLTQCEKEKKKKDEDAYIDPELSRKAKEEGNDHYKAARYPEAVKCYDEAVKRNPTDHLPYSNRAGALLKLTAYDDAVRDCDKAIELCPTFVRAYARKAQVYMLTKQFNRALVTYDEGLKIDPNHDECKEGRMKCMYKIQEIAGSEGNEEVAARAMQDPEIQGILNDSYMQMVLGEVQRNPQRLNDYMQDQRIATNINKLIQAGVLRMGSGPAQGGQQPGRR